MTTRPDRPRGRPRHADPPRRLSARVPASIFDPVKQFADDHAEPLSAIVSEALAAYLSREIRRECPACGLGNPEGSDWCRVCGSPLTASARKKIGDDTDRILDNITARSLTELERNLNEVFSQVQSKILAKLEKMEEGEWEVSVRVRSRVRESGQEPITPEEQT